MTVLARYLNRMFLVRLLVVLFGIIGFATIIDLIDVGPELVNAPEGALAAGLRYPKLFKREPKVILFEDEVKLLEGRTVCLEYYLAVFMASCMSGPRSAKVLATLMPFELRYFIFDAALPCPPSPTIAPACPILFSAGAV